MTNLDTSTDQIELLLVTLKALEASTGSQLRDFNFTPKFIGANLIKVNMTLKFDPMVEENL